MCMRSIHLSNAVISINNLNDLIFSANILASVQNIVNTHTHIPTWRQ